MSLKIFEMETTELKQQLHKYIEQANEHSLYLIYDILRSDTDEDWWDNLHPELKSSIDKSMIIYFFLEEASLSCGTYKACQFVL